MITFTCGQCSTAIQVTDEHAGRQGRCPGCGTVVTIPPSSAVAAQPPMQPPAPMPPPAWGPAPMPPGFGGPSKTLAVLAMIFGFVAIIPFLGALCGLSALIMGGISLAGKKPGKGMAITGVIAGLLLGAGSTVAGVYLVVLPIQRAGQAAVCASNLHMVGAGLAMYSSAHDGKLPDSLQKLVEEGYVDQKALTCPVAAGRPRSGCDYVYAKHLKNIYSAGGDTIVACDRKGNHEGSRNVLYVDGSVRSLKTDAEFQKLLREPQNAAMAKHLREIEGP